MNSDNLTSLLSKLSENKLLMLYQDFKELSDENIILINLQLITSNQQKQMSNNIPVNRFDTIYSINSIIRSQFYNDTDQIFDKRKFTFIYHGIIITNSALSLSFFGIKNNDTLTVIEQAKPFTNNFSISNHEKFTNFYKGRGKFLERGRLHDILLSKIEGNPLYYRKNIYRFEQMVEFEDHSNNGNPRTVIEDPQEAPSTHVLPQAWSEEDTVLPKH